MSFLRRIITLKIALNGDTFDSAGNDTIQLSGIRCRATVKATTGGSTPYQGMAQVSLWGMLPDDMAKLSTLGLTCGVYNKNRIQVYAGDNSGANACIFDGGIYTAEVDYNAMPDVGVHLMAYETIGVALPPIAASSYKGSMSVANMLSAIASTAGLSFVNNGVQAVLSNHAVGGSANDQIADICLASMTNYEIRNGTLTIWPQGASRDSTVINLSPNSGMVGYPMYTAQGIDVVSEFNPDIELGRQMNVTSSIPNPGPNAPVNPSGVSPIGANGTFYIFDVVHDISSELPNGPWFTRASLGTVNTQVRAS